MRFSNTLFVDNTPLNFLIHECTDGEFIATLLKCGGGAVHEGGAPPSDTIRLAGEGFAVGPSCDGPSLEDTLGIDFVVACCMADTLVNFEPQFLFRAGYKYQPTYQRDLRTLRQEYAAWVSRAGAGGPASHTEQSRAGGGGRDKATVKQGGDKLTAKQGGGKSTVKQGADKSPVKQGRGKSTVKQGADKSPVKQRRDKLPVKQVADKLPVTQVADKSPVKHGRDKSPVKQVADKSSVKQGRDRSPVNQERDTSPVNHESDRPKSPARQGTKRSAERRRMEMPTAKGSTERAGGGGKRGRLTQEEAPNSSDSDEGEEFLVGNKDRTPRQPPAGGVPFNKQQGYYTNTERNNMVKYITSHDAYSQVSGRSFWQLMEERQVCPGRSWASLREHFHRRIKPSIAQFGLDADTLRKFRHVFDPEQWKCPADGLVSSSQAFCSSQLPSSSRSRGGQKLCDVEREISPDLAPDRAAQSDSPDRAAQSDSGDDDSTSRNKVTTSQRDNAIYSPVKEFPPDAPVKEVPPDAPMKESKTSVTAAVKKMTPSLDDDPRDVVAVCCERCFAIGPYSRAAFLGGRRSHAYCPRCCTKGRPTRVRLFFWITLLLELTASRATFPVVLSGVAVKSFFGCTVKQYLSTVDKSARERVRRRLVGLARRRLEIANSLTLALPDPDRGSDAMLMLDRVTFADKPCPVTSSQQRLVVTQ